MKKVLDNCYNFCYNSIHKIKTDLINKYKKITKRTHKMSNNKNKEAKTSKKSNKNYKSGTIGIMLLFAVASIAYSTVVIAIGTEGIVPLIMVAPQALLGTAILVKKFSK